jgi:hypothetical protein
MLDYNGYLKGEILLEWKMQSRLVSFHRVSDDQRLAGWQQEKIFSLGYDFHYDSDQDYEDDCQGFVGAHVRDGECTEG